MDPIDTYLSIGGESSGSYREKASKFISLAIPVSNELDVKVKMDQLRKEYHDASHFCYAYRLGSGNESIRVNDDGEPSGSAGKPIYGQILSQNLSDVLVVVIRYYGGKKLGIPGLIRAYRTSACDALSHALIITKTLTVEHTIQFPYVSMNEVMRILKEEDARITNLNSAEICQLMFTIRLSLNEKVVLRLNRIKDLSASVHIG